MIHRRAALTPISPSTGSQALQLPTEREKC